jgi:hypothetical protein
MSSKGIGIVVYPSSSFFQAVTTGTSSGQAAEVQCADFQYGTVYFEVNNATVNTNIGLIILDQPYSGANFFVRSIENPLYLDGTNIVGAPSYITSILPNIKLFSSGSDALGDSPQFSHTFQIFGSYGVSAYVADFSGETGAQVTASLVLFKGI